ncbi:glycosyl transferase [Jannaschia pagri]|uniref:Peptide O-xylosyltransferase n=1 Tax=Jannaschia pagri TaxID=2829797 RepID=A0ABQ4NK92_9RHOB|nr:MULTISPECIES: DUF5928 domain-containing protein [unclassified Jannaschia]GIT90991.1 glycosyl transferase [Jannaschia sp. AI_61]GIT94823.1 glycosyl transferase [Jannaschia sp. AI_62]
MAKIAFILLCHKDPAAIVRQANGLTAAGDCVAIHFDARAPREALAAIEAGTRDNPNVVLVTRRVRCGWGEWSLVRATLAAVRAAFAAFPDATHFYMVSGDCRPIKSSDHAHAFLDARDVDYIESFDFFTSDWIKTGMKEDRLIYRHIVNERGRKWLFYTLLDLQKRLGLSRAIPADIDVQIGSQWWCLRRTTIEKILAFCAKRRDVLRFFSTTWIPDETFFQTLVRHLVPRPQIDPRTLTFLMFTDYGMPATFYNDHYDLLVSQDFLFARKISPEAADLKDRLESLWTSGQTDFPVAGDGRKLFSFLTQRGREGRRFAARIWDQQGALGRDLELVVLVCKKYHVAKRLTEALRHHGVIPAIDYVFDEEGIDLPNLGGIENRRAKRHRHRRALLRLLFRQLQTDRLAICLDPANLDLLQDLSGDRVRLKTVIIDCDYDAAYLEGHAARIGLIGAETPRNTIDRLIPTVAQDFAGEIQRIRDADLPVLFRLHQAASVDVNAQTLAAALECPPDVAQHLAETPYLFAD